jgi:two-component system sensor histidine kinase RpfC
MNRIAAFRARLRARADSEHEQAILRIVITALLLAYLGLTYAPTTGGGDARLPFVVLFAAYLAFAIALFVAICIWPGPSILRRFVGMIADIGTATFCMFLAEETGVVVIGVYLFLTFGYGFRYGRRYLLACQALCVLGFFAVVRYVPYWQVHSVASWALMVALIVLPLYVSTLLQRIEQKHVETERALKECLERERRAR